MTISTTIGLVTVGAIAYAYIGVFVARWSVARWSDGELEPELLGILWPVTVLALLGWLVVRPWVRGAALFAGWLDGVIPKREQDIEIMEREAERALRDAGYPERLE